MIAKELIEARWKAVIGAIVGTLTILVGAFSFDLMRSALNPEQLENISKILGSDFTSRLLDYRAFVWNQTYSTTGNNGVILIIVAALLGASLIAGEVNKGTIFFLLSRPLNRDRVLLTKYSVGATLLLGMSVLSGIVVYVGAALDGRPQDIGGVLVSSLLFWLGTLFVFGLATLLSVVFSDVLRPLALTLGSIIVLSLPGLFPNGGTWVIPSYWSSLPAFVGLEFPAKELLVSAVAALIPVLGAVGLFRRQAY